MSAGTLELVDQDAETKTSDDDDFDHILCHCNLAKGWCGENVRVIAGDILESSGNDCPKCSELALQYALRCPYGCDCTSEMRYYNCVDGEEDEDE